MSEEFDIPDFFESSYIVTLPDSMRKFVEQHADMVTHTDGIAWNDAAKPRRRHKCTAQSTASRTSRDDSGTVAIVQVCARGGIRDVHHGRWYGRNSRRK